MINHKGSDAVSMQAVEDLITMSFLQHPLYCLK